MKKTVSILLLSLATIACSRTTGPQCSDENVKSTLKEIYIENGENDINEILIEGITTIEKNNELNSCKCTATTTLTRIDTNITDSQYQQKFAITYSAQLTDNGENITVKILDQENE